MQVQVLNGLVAANGAPVGITAGVPLFRDSRAMQFTNPQLDGFYDNVDEATLVLKLTGTGILTVSYLRGWGFIQLSKGAAGVSAPQGTDASDWFPMGTGADADKGKLNGTTVALGEVKVDTVLHMEKIRGLRDLSRFYLEVGVVGGAPTSLDAWLVARGQAQP